MIDVNCCSTTDYSAIILKFCSLCTDTEDIKRWLKQPSSTLKFGDIIDAESEWGDAPFVICKQLPDNVRVILDDFKRYKERTVFYQLFVSKLESRKHSTLAETAQVYGETLKDYNDLVKQFETGGLVVLLS